MSSSPAPIRLRVDDRPPADQPARPDRFVDVAIEPRPRLSWVVPLWRDGQAQTAYEIRVAPDGLDPRGCPRAELTWGSGRVESAESTWIRPDAELTAHGRWAWTVRVCDEHDAWSPWADPVALETGPFSAADWSASWLGAPSTSAVTGVVVLPGAPIRARLHVTGQGLYRASIGGVAVNPGTAEPSRTDPVRALSRTYDVTDLLREGQNDLELVLGASHWRASGLDPRVLAEVVAVLPDGSVHRAGTGTGWRTRRSQVVVDEAFYVEAHDGRHAADASGGEPATVLGPAGVTTGTEPVPLLPRRIEPDPAPPIRVGAELGTRELRRTTTGSRIFDAGENIAGRSRLTLHSALPPGTSLTLVHGELLHPDGGVDTTNLKMPYDTGRHRQSVEYTAAGRPGEQAEAWFAFHGFRYVEVIGLPDDAEVEVHALVLHSDLPRLAGFSSDDATLERLVAAASRTQLNNAHGIPEDCPTREQSGWTGDAAATTDLALAHLDLAGFYRKWLGDLATSQRDDGALPAIAPSLRPDATPPDPVWGSALQRVLLGHWHHYGDRSVVEAHLDSLRRWADYQLGLVRDGVVSGAAISYGHDWLGLEQTPPEVLHTGAALDALDSLAELEAALGDDPAAELRRGQAATLRASARAVFHDPERGTWGNGSQGSSGVAMAAGLATPAEARLLGARVAEVMHARGNRITTGFGATSTVVRALAGVGRSQAISDAIHQPAQPGVGAMLVDGPGTLWESWWIDPRNTGTGSLDHVGLGGPFAGWVWTTLVGVRPSAPGFRSFVVAPQPVDGVSRAASVTETVRGTVRAGWQRVGDRLVVDVEVPVGSSATVRLPGTDDVELGSGRHRTETGWPAPTASSPAPTPPFQAPARAPVPSDVRGGGGWLAAAVEAGSLTPTVDLAALDVLPEGIVCMPVHHAQLGGPVVRATGRTDTGAEVPQLLRIDFPEPLDLTTATFGYAMVDLCLATPHGMRPELVLRVHSATAGERVGYARVWPAGWNRVAAGLGDWAGRADVVAVEAGVRFRHDVAATDSVLYQADAPAVPVAFHLGEVGWSAARRTW
ncbi:MAG TPA: family 78 glycoside hydrolase catalytic domain [Jiangellaceae bacterium]